MATKQSVYPLRGKVQHYAWGGQAYLPRLLRTDNAGGQPFAEYWLGAHPSYSSTIIVDGQPTDLATFISRQPAEALGEAVAGQFASLPYLLKVLDVRQMLSIQVHPDKASARAAFAAENTAGIPLTAFNRNYKDENHKPELMVALGDFWLLHGFKPAGALSDVLSTHPDFDFLLGLFEQEGYEGLYRRVMTMDQAEVDAILKPVADRIVPLYQNGELKKEDEDFWAARAVETFCTRGTYDRGIFSIYFFNLLHLKRGEGIYQPAGLPHAYLEGQNVEIMANSDNVLRAGLTDKHIDIGELMKHVRFEATVPAIIREETGTVTVYRSPAAEFELSQYRVQGGESIRLATTGPELVLVLEGNLSVAGGAESLSLQPGEAGYLLPGSEVEVTAGGAGTFFRAAVPQAGKN